MRLGVGYWVLGIAMLGASACGSSTSGVPAGTIVVAVRSSPNTFDPRVATDEVSQRVTQLVYSPLMEIDDELRVVPGLALTLDNPDALTYIARLRRGVKFHDGRQLTAKDVVYTFASFLDPNFVSARKGAYRQLESVTALDDYTVRFHLKEPFGSFPVQLVMPIVPADAGDSLRTFPIGTGPYRYVRYLVDDRVELSAFAEYYDGPPKNDGIVLKVIPDETMRGLELRKGVVDVAINEISPDVAHRFESDPALHVTESPAVDYAYIGINLRDSVLSDKRVRHALAHAVNRKAIVDYLRRGRARPAVGVLAPIAWAFEPNVRQFDYDPERAKQLLDEAGYPDPDGDGPRPRLHLSLKTSTDEFMRLQATVLQQDFQAVGIDVDVRSYEFATFYADVLKGNFQLYTLQWVGVTDPDMLRRVFHSQQVPPAGFNRGYYSNPEVDRLIDLATRSTDDDERRRYYGEVQKLVAEDVPYVSLWYKTNISVTQATISGLRLNATADFSSLKEARKGKSVSP